jgi:hypothetical protein
VQCFLCGGGEKKLDVCFSAKKAVDACREVVPSKEDSTSDPEPQNLIQEGRV